GAARGPQGAGCTAAGVQEATATQATHPFPKTMSLPAGSYPGQSEPIVSVGSWSFVLVRPDLPEENVYRLARALHRGEPILAARLPQGHETTAANTVTAPPRAEVIHPGARRYFREIGLIP